MPVKVTEKQKRKKQDNVERADNYTAAINLVKDNRPSRGHDRCCESSGRARGNLIYEKKLPSKKGSFKRVDPKKYPPEPADDDLFK